MKPETVFQIKVLRELRKLPHAWFEKISQRTTRGTPDILGVVESMFVALELKSRGGKATPLQILKLREIELAGGYVAVVDPDNFPTVMRKLWSFLKDERSMTFCVGSTQSDETGVQEQQRKESR